MKKGFTLSEVLITLGIVGVVAVLTVPGVMKNYKSRLYTAQLQKAYAQIADSVQAMMNDQHVDNFYESTIANANSCTDANKGICEKDISRNEFLKQKIDEFAFEKEANELEYNYQKLQKEIVNLGIKPKYVLLEQEKMPIHQSTMEAQKLLMLNTVSKIQMVQQSVANGMQKIKWFTC